MKTILHSYFFNLSNVADREPYVQLIAKLRAEKDRGQWHNAISLPEKGHITSTKPLEVELDTDHAFSNQWNSSAGRVFDWWEGINPQNRLLKFGHYLDLTPEMVAFRKGTFKCKYTGRDFHKDDPMVAVGFNTSHSALGSEYLKEDDLWMLRLLPVYGDPKRGKLTEAEREMLLPLYLEAQSKAAGERDQEAAGKRLLEAQKNRDQAIARAHTEYDGFSWLIERGIPIRNVIYYHHSGVFSFGWQGGYSESVAKIFATKLEGFPFRFEIKAAK